MKKRAKFIHLGMKQFVDESGNAISMRDVLFVKDMSKLYLVKNGCRSKINGYFYHDGEDKEEKNLGDGAIVSLVKLAFQGQCISTGLKGFFVDGTSSIKALCKKHGLTIEQFMDLQVMGIDGKMHRIGDYKAIADEGCWKFERTFSNLTSYIKWLEEIAANYNGLDALYLLRQSEEIEKEDEIRRLTKTLIQQQMLMSPKEIRKLTDMAREVT